MICDISGRDCPTLDEHHVIPREYGGINGPTVKIDPAIHQAVHRYVNQPKKLAVFLSNYAPEVRARIKVLVNAIKEAETTLERVQSCSLNITLEKEEYERLSQIAKDMNMSETQVAKRLLSNLLSR